MCPPLVGPTDEVLANYFPWSFRTPSVPKLSTVPLLSVKAVPPGIRVSPVLPKTTKSLFYVARAAVRVRPLAEIVVVVSRLVTATYISLLKLVLRLLPAPTYTNWSRLRTPANARATPREALLCRIAYACADRYKEYRIVVFIIVLCSMTGIQLKIFSRDKSGFAI
jgi:hypothetical protein